MSNNTPSISFGDAIRICINKFVDFSGRASRAEFWYWYLFSFLVLIIPGWIMGATSGAIHTIFAIIYWILAAILILPSLAVAWRRLHDTGRAGGWWFISFIPLIGQIILIIWWATPGQPESNRFGAPTSR